LGVVRFSSFVDLAQVAFANLLSLIISILISFLLEYYDVNVLTAFSQAIIVFFIFLGYFFDVGGVRILVKNLHDIANNDNTLTRVLIYGAMTRGVGLAKNIRNQKPMKFQLCRFISNN